MIYLDDMVVYSKTFEEYIQHLKDMFDRLKVEGSALKPEKSQIAEHCINLLGFTLDCERCAGNQTCTPRSYRLPGRFLG